MGTRSIISRCADVLEQVQYLLIRALSLGLIVVVFGGVMLRYVFRIPLVWGEELAMFIFVWLAFLCSSVAVRRKAHFRMSALMELLPRPLRLPLETLTLILMATLTGVLLWHGLQFAVSGIREQAPGLQVAMTWAYAAVPISAISMAVFLAEAFLGGGAPRGDT